MSTQLMNLPINIPWKLIAASPDMLDTKFCNKLFPFAWRSSLLAISVFEPKLEVLPYDIKTVQELLGHKDLKRTMIYTRALNRGGKEVKSPVDDL